MSERITHEPIQHTRIEDSLTDDQTRLYNATSGDHTTGQALSDAFPSTEAFTIDEQVDALGINEEQTKELLNEPFINIQEVYIVLGKLDMIDRNDPEYGEVRGYKESELHTLQINLLTQGLSSSVSYQRFVDKVPLPSDSLAHVAPILKVERERNNRLWQRGTEYAGHMLAIHEKLNNNNNSDEFRQRYGVQTQRNLYEDIVDQEERVGTLYREFQSLVRQKTAIIKVAGGRKGLDSIIAEEYGEDVLEGMKGSLEHEVVLMRTHLPDLIKRRNDGKHTVSEKEAEAIYDDAVEQTDSVYEIDLQEINDQHEQAISAADAALEFGKSNAKEKQQSGYTHAEEKKASKLDADEDSIEQQIGTLSTSCMQAWYKTPAGKEHRQKTTNGSGKYENVYDELTAILLAMASPDYIQFEGHWEISEQSRQQRRSSGILGRIRDRSETEPETNVQPKQAAQPAPNVGVAAVRQTAVRPPNKSTSSFTMPGISRTDPQSMAATTMEVIKTTRDMFDIKAALKVPEHGQLIATRVLVAKILQIPAYADLNKDEIFRELESDNSPYQRLLRGTPSGNGQNPEFRKVLAAAYSKRRGSTRSDIFQLLNQPGIPEYFMNTVLEDSWFQKNWMEDYGITQEMLTLNIRG